MHNLYPPSKASFSQHQTVNLSNRTLLILLTKKYKQKQKQKIVQFQKQANTIHPIHETKHRLAIKKDQNDEENIFIAQRHRILKRSKNKSKLGENMQKNNIYQSQILMGRNLQLQKDFQLSFRSMIKKKPLLTKEASIKSSISLLSQTSKTKRNMTSYRSDSKRYEQDCQQQQNGRQSMHQLNVKTYDESNFKSHHYRFPKFKLKAKNRTQRSQRMMECNKGEMNRHLNGCEPWSDQFSQHKLRANGLQERSADLQSWIQIENTQ